MIRRLTRVKYPIGIQEFEKLRNEGYIYVDKTALVYSLAHEGSYYFLSRPRRFGKSLLISTLDAYFSGRKDLFEGLAIEQFEKEWTKYPVLHLDLNGGDYSNMEGLREVLDLQLSEWEKLYGKNLAEKSPAGRFGGIIKRACVETGQKVAILVDEYDKPLLQNIDNEELQGKMREEMKSVFSQLKKQDQYIRFGFLTGVTKFSKVSIFSDLNNLTDLTLDARCECICGISKQEVTEYFKEPIKDMAAEYGVDEDAMLAMLQRKYDGYHFSENMTDMFNPFSVFTAMRKRKLGDYWFETGTPTFLIKLIQKNGIAVDSLDGMMMNEKDLSKVDNMLRNPKPVLYQSGYLTIKDYDRGEDIYTLGFPNEEVSDGFFNYLLPCYANVGESDVSSTIFRMRKAIQADDIDTFMTILKSFFAGYDYSLIGKEGLEAHYHNVIYIMCKLLGLRVKAEYHTSNGRIDMLIETDMSVFIFEFKLNVGTKRALKQIEEKDYAAPFAADSRKVYKIGVNFSTRIRGNKGLESRERKKMIL